MIIRPTILIHHDAFDPSANDTTMDLTALIREKLHEAFDFDDDDIVELDDGFVITPRLEIADPAQYHVED